MLSVVFAMSLAAGELRTVQADTSVTLDGTLGTYGWINPRDGTLHHATALMLFAPVDVVGVEGKVLLRGAVLVDMPAKDDTMLLRYGELIGKRIRATCQVWVSKTWGYDHAFCAVTSVEPAT